jgi:hypothetical protein
MGDMVRLLDRQYEAAAAEESEAMHGQGDRFADIRSEVRPEHEDSLTLMLMSMRSLHESWHGAIDEVDGLRGQRHECGQALEILQCEALYWQVTVGSNLPLRSFVEEFG